MEQNWIKEFKQYLVIERQYSDETLKAYSEDIQLFCDFLQESGSSTSFGEIKRLDVHAYMNFLYDKQYQTTTISRMVSSLRSLYHFLEKNGYVTNNPFSYVQLKRHPRALPRFFYEKEMQALFDATQGDDPMIIRDNALLEALYATGMRVSECTGLTLEAIDSEVRAMLLHGKGSKDAMYPMADIVNGHLIAIFRKQEHHCLKNIIKTMIMFLLIIMVTR
ncbi:site-specific tyrosine recombinase [Liquorilactobacillus sucicola DSM 21376 = JCM 15457]|nr:site-specific tyrosine recombinase [Liquorilactobacillus sucicola DSM 21376 = JCM 15457]